MKKEASNNNSTKVRDSSLELMRIISMFFIVLYHIILHCNFLNTSTGSIKVLFDLILSFIIIHVNSFIVITGYFQSKSKFKFSKLLAINNSTWFYKILIPIILIILSIIKIPDKISIFKILMPIDYGTYWYINNYIVLYLLSPYLNHVVEGMNKNQFKRLLIIFFIFISLIPTFTHDYSFNTYGGRSLITFIMLYFIGAYLRKFPIEFEGIFENKTEKAKQLIYLCLYIFFAVLSFLVLRFGIELTNNGELSYYFGVNLQNFNASYASPIIVLETVFYFMFFKSLKIKSKFINIVSSLTLGVYQISENIYLRENIYDYFKLTKIQNVSGRYILYSIVSAFLVFWICIILELIRQKVFKFIYNRKFASKFRNKIRNYFSDLGFDISW